MPLLSINFLKKQMEKHKMCSLMQQGFLDTLTLYGIRNPMEKIAVLYDTIITKSAASEFDLMNMGFDQNTIEQLKQVLAAHNMDLASLSTEELAQIAQEISGSMAGNQFMM